ncbi:MAG: translocation/assembly module TamB domain-containing protein, partial [Elusimicrobiota bacterium]
IRVMQLHRNKETLVITGSGKIPLDTAKPVNMLFQIEKGDLSFLETYSDIVKTSRGKIEGRMQITGNFQNPNFGGFILLSEGNIEAKSYFSAIKRLNAGITFDGNKLEIKEFSGKIGEGRFNIAGYLLMGKLFEIEEYNLALETPDKKGLKIYIPELPLPSGQFLKTAGLEGLIKNYSSGEPHINVKLAGKKSDIKLTGYVRLDNTYFCYPAPAGAGKVNLASGILKDINMDIEILTGENTWYESDLMSVNINGFLKLTDKLSKLMVNGKIEAVRGNINYINKVYEIREAVFEVIRNECFLEARAQTSAVFTTKRTALPSDTSASLPQEETKESGTVEMVIPRSNIGNIVPTFLSSTRPDMDSQKLIQATYGISGPHDSSLFMKQQLVRLFDSSLASPLARNFLRKSGLIDTAKVTYEPSSETSGTRASPAAGQESFLDMMKGTKYVLEKYLTGDLLLGYALTLNEIQRKLDLRHEFELAYRWKGNIFLRGIYGVEPRRLETNDWQIRVEPRWRFGGWGNDTQNDAQ